MRLHIQFLIEGLIVEFKTLNDAYTYFVNSGFFEAANLNMESQIVEFIYLNDCDTETALNTLGGWL